MNPVVQALLATLFRRRGATPRGATWQPDIATMSAVVGFTVMTLGVALG